MDSQYWAFISYSHRDRRWCDWLHRAIETYSVPPRLVGRTTNNGPVPRKIFPIFRDRDELSSSSDLNASVSDALQRSRYLVVICSPAAAASRWVNEEIRRFKSLGRAHRILCLIVDGEPPQCFPPSLLDDHQRAMPPTRAFEPLAADVRSGHDGFAQAKLKIIAALLGVGFDELARRDLQRQRQSQVFGAVLAGLMASILLLPDFGPLPGVRLAAFDAYQRLFPRTPKSSPVVIVEIDEASIARIGQWPWPRYKLAELTNRIASRKPAAIGFDMFFPEPDRVSPDQLAQQIPGLDAKTAEALARLPSPDAVFAQAIRTAKVVLAVAGTYDRPFRRGPPTAFVERGPPAPLPTYPGQLRSLAALDGAAAGHGLINVQTQRGVVRTAELVARVGDPPSPVLELALECLRVAAGESRFTLVSDAVGLRRVVIGDLAVPTQPDGSYWLHFSRAGRARYISAADVLQGRDDPAWLDRRLVIVGVTAGGLAPMVRTSAGETTPGVEIHAQVLENIFDSSFLVRPDWGRLAEAVAFLLSAGILIVGVPRISPRLSFGLPVAISLLLVCGCLAAFRFERILLDWATVVMAVAVLFAASMTFGFAINAQRQLPS